MLLAPAGHFGQVTGIQFQVATANNPAGTRITRMFFKHLEESVLKAESYRGKILSLEAVGAFVLRRVVRNQGPQAPHRGARPGDPAAKDARPARSQRRPVRPAAVPAGAVPAVDQEGHPVLRAARHRQDAYDPLPGRVPRGAYDAAGHRRAGRIARRVHDAGEAAPAQHRRHRGRGPHRRRSATSWTRARKSC